MTRKVFILVGGVITILLILILAFFLLRDEAEEEKDSEIITGEDIEINENKNIQGQVEISVNYYGEDKENYMVDVYKSDTLLDVLSRLDKNKDEDFSVSFTKYNFGFVIRDVNDLKLKMCDSWDYDEEPKVFSSDYLNEYDVEPGEKFVLSVEDSGGDGPCYIL